MTGSVRRRGLAKGLSALLDDEVTFQPEAEAVGPSHTLPIDRLQPSPFQPRRRFDEDQLEALAESIRGKGLVQPILVRESTAEAGMYEIVAGERRWRAAQRARLHEVPVIVRTLSDRDALEIAVIENLQRENLTAIEEAEAYRRLIDEFGGTQDEVAGSVGKSRSHVANTIRLLSLPDTVKRLIEGGELSSGHARALIGTSDPESLARAIVKRGLNVRQTEKLVQGARTGGKPAEPRAKDADISALERELAELLGLKVSIADRGERGELRIAYGSLEQLDDVIRRLRGSVI